LRWRNTHLEGNSTDAKSNYRMILKTNWSWTLMAFTNSRIMEIMKISFKTMRYPMFRTKVSYADIDNDNDFIMNWLILFDNNFSNKYRSKACITTHTSTALSLTNRGSPNQELIIHWLTKRRLSIIPIPRKMLPSRKDWLNSTARVKKYQLSTSLINKLLPLSHTPKGKITINSFLSWGRPSISMSLASKNNSLSNIYNIKPSSYKRRM